MKEKDEYLELAKGADFAIKVLCFLGVLGWILDMIF